MLLTDEELKLMKQEGYQIPTKLPLSKTEEKILKKIRRKIKNKVRGEHRQELYFSHRINSLHSIRFLHKKVDERKKNTSIHSNDK